jgi:hypothetical protein
LCVFFWVFPRRHIVICRRFGTFCQFHLQRLVVEYSTTSLWRWNWQKVPKRRQIKIWRRGNTQKNTHNMQNTTKVWNQEPSICCCYSTYHIESLPRPILISKWHTLWRYTRTYHFIYARNKKYVLPSFDFHKFTDAWEEYLCIIYTELNPNPTINDVSGLPSVYFRRPENSYQLFNLRSANLLYGLLHNSVKSGYIVKLTYNLLWLTVISMSVLKWCTTSELISRKK